MTVEYHPEVERELREAREFYEQRLPGLGGRFIDEFERQVLRMAATPGRWRVIEADIRRALMSRFPYVIYFRALAPDRIRITVVKHQRRHPGLRVALAQIPIEDGNLDLNLRLAENAAERAAQQKVDFFNLPEAADWGWLHQHARRDAMPIPGKYTGFLAGLAKRHHIWVSAGCLERDEEMVFNSAVIIDRTGRMVLKHRKIDTLPWLTKDLYDRGNPEDIGVVDTEFGRIGLTICADNFNLKNPQRVADQGAWLLIAPHGFAEEEGKLEQNAKSYRDHISRVAGTTRLWVLGTDAVLGTVQGGAWRGRLHSGCSVVARPDGTAAVVGNFKQPDLVVFDIPAEK